MELQNRQKDFQSIRQNILYQNGKMLTPSEEEFLISERKRDREYFQRQANQESQI